MDISAIISDDGCASGYSPVSRPQPRTVHPYPTRHGNMPQASPGSVSTTSAQPQQHTRHELMGPTPGSTPRSLHSPQDPAGKSVQFQLLLSPTSHRAQRLPMRVVLRPTDMPEGILESVKKFWGLYEGQGISLEDNHGNTLIAQYENFVPGQNVFVRVYAAEPDVTERGHPHTHDQQALSRPQLGDPIQMMSSHQSISRPDSRSTKRREGSPRLERMQHNGVNRSQPYKARSADEENSDSDGASVSSSRRTRSELPSTEISVHNIVEGNRRPAAKFESSELPLFAPPQQPMTASISSLSPQRRFTNGNIPSPVQWSNQKTFSYPNNPAAFSPQSYGHVNGSAIHRSSITGGAPYGQYNPAGGHQLRGVGPRGPHRLSGHGMPVLLPTPDPTIGSVISDEDVALQLMRLGEASNMSSRGRTSTSTLDDAFSGKAEMASSGDVSEAEDEHDPLQSNGHTHGPVRKKQRQSESVVKHPSRSHLSSDDYEDRKDESFKGDSDGIGPDAYGGSFTKPKAKSGKSQSRNNSISTNKSRQGASKSKGKSASAAKIPPFSYVPDHAARTDSGASSAHTQPEGFGADDEDLSSKPRCQRCRKSKKGCDRQRPCQRCKDAGIGADGCISEDEGNGRKGKFGRHMGVPLLKTSGEGATASPTSVTKVEYGLSDDGSFTNEASKKRKR